MIGRAAVTQVAVLAALIVGAGTAMNAAGVPSPYLFAALLIGLIRALAIPQQLELPRRVFVAAQAITGVTLGTYLQRSSLHVIADDWLAVALVSLATLGISLAAGNVLARLTILDRPTAALGMIAGGASGIVGISDDLGGDDRLVAFMQYLRVLVVVLVTPALVGVILIPSPFTRATWTTAPSVALTAGTIPLVAGALSLHDGACACPARAPMCTSTSGCGSVRTRPSASNSATRSPSVWTWRRGRGVPEVSKILGSRSGSGGGS